MKHLLKQLLAVGAVAAIVWLATAWPRLNEVETGRTPDYPNLHGHDYGASVDAVTRAIKVLTTRLSRWEIVGTGKGPAGAEIQAVKAILLFKYDVTIKLRRDRGRTYVDVRSKSRIGPWDFGQNARNIRELLDALDREVF